MTGERIMELKRRITHDLWGASFLDAELSQISHDDLARAMDESKEALAELERLKSPQTFTEVTISLNLHRTVKLAFPMTEKQVESIALGAARDAIRKSLGTGGGNMTCLVRGVR